MKKIYKNALFLNASVFSLGSIFIYTIYLVGVGAEEKCIERVISNTEELNYASTVYQFFVKNSTQYDYIALKAISLIDNVKDDGAMSTVTGVIARDEKVKVELYGQGGMDALFLLLAHPCKGDGEHLTHKTGDRQIFWGWMRWSDFVGYDLVFDIRNEDLTPARTIKDIPHLSKNAFVMDYSGRVCEIDGRSVDPEIEQEWSQGADGKLHLRLVKPEQEEETREYSFGEGGLRRAVEFPPIELKKSDDKDKVSEN